jgi:hypothetical protein
MKNDTELKLLELLEAYHHYKFMTAGFFRGVFDENKGMSFYDFIQWLKSRQQ